MPLAQPLSPRRDVPLNHDGIGGRVTAVDSATGEQLHILRIRQPLSRVPGFDFALRDRAARLADFHYASYARVRRIERVASFRGELDVVSDPVEGMRLSDLLAIANARGIEIDISTALNVISQLVRAMAALHEHGSDLANGLIAPERIILTPQARLVVVEHVLGAAIQQLQYSSDRLWREFRIAVPPGTSPVRFDQQSDIMGVGLVALTLVVGRPLREDEFPGRLSALLDEARERAAVGYERPLSPPLRDWLARVLQLDGRAFTSSREVCEAFDRIVGDSLYVTAPISLEMFLSRCASVPGEPARGVAAGEVVTAPQPDEGEIDWAAIDAQPATVATAVEISALLTAADLPGQVDEIADAPVGSPPHVSFDEIEVKPARVWHLTMPTRMWHIAMPARVRRLAMPAGGTKVLRWSAFAAALLLLCGGGAFAAWLLFADVSAASELGTLVVQSNPAGLQILVDGMDQGRTPARVPLSAGAHTLEVRGRREPVVIPLNISTGAEVVQHLEFPVEPETGEVRVESRPDGATVLLDGISKGIAPLTIADLAPGDHEIILQTPKGSARHVVNVRAGASVTLSVPIPLESAPVPESGWLAVKAPFPVEIRTRGRAIGTSGTGRTRIAPGRHEIQLVNDSVGYRTGRVVHVSAGKIATVAVDPPKGLVNINAQPWAEVWIAGKRVGETPLANVSVPAGRQEIVFRHPQLGEKRQTISVTLGAPVRVSVDMK